MGTCSGAMWDLPRLEIEPVPALEGIDSYSLPPGESLCAHIYEHFLFAVVTLAVLAYM